MWRQYCQEKHHPVMRHHALHASQSCPRSGSQTGHRAARMLLAKGDAVGYAESDKGYFFLFWFCCRKKRKGLTLPLSQHATSTHQGLCQRLKVSRKKRNKHAALACNSG